MKKVLLLCLAALLLMQGVCLAKIQKQVDKFDGSYCYFVNHSLSDLEFSFLLSSFNVFFTPDNIYDGKTFEICFTKDNGYSIHDTIKLHIDDTIYTWKTESDSIRSAFVKRSFPIPSNVLDALMQTKKGIIVRFYFSALSGDYVKDFVIPYKRIKEIQTMFHTHLPKENLQPAR